MISGLLRVRPTGGKGLAGENHPVGEKLLAEDIKGKIRVRAAEYGLVLKEAKFH